MAQARFIYEAPGANITQLYGPAPAAGVASSGIPAQIFKPGETLEGDAGAVFIFCTLVLGSTTSLTPGQAYTIDKDFAATLLTTANSPRGTSVGFSQVYQASNLAGTYYLWLQIKGHGPSAAIASSAANALAETSATGGSVNYNNTPTATTKKIVGLYLLQASQTFTGTLVNGSPVITLVPGTSITDISLGAAISGTGIPASTTIISIVKSTNGSTYTITMSANATASNAGVTVTAVGVITADILFPYIDLTNP